jgi:hypothetical protein
VKAVRSSEVAGQFRHINIRKLAVLGEGGGNALDRWPMASQQLAGLRLEGVSGQTEPAQRVPDDFEISPSMRPVARVFPVVTVTGGRPRCSVPEQLALGLREWPGVADDGAYWVRDGPPRFHSYDPATALKAGSGVLESGLAGEECASMAGFMVSQRVQRDGVSASLSHGDRYQGAAGQSQQLPLDRRLAGETQDTP